MRIDVKKVKGKEYLQLVEGKKIFHIGSAADFDSWLVAYMVWEKKWREEYLRRRQEMLATIEHNISERIPTSNLELLVFKKIRERGQYDFRLALNSLRLPRLPIYGDYREIENPDPEVYDTRWIITERGRKIRKRVRDIGYKSRRINR